MQFLNNLGFNFIDDFVIIPSFRNDIVCQNDLAEEIARCLGYDNISTKEIEILKDKEILRNSVENNIKESIDY